MYNRSERVIGDVIAAGGDTSYALTRGPCEYVLAGDLNGDGELQAQMISGYQEDLDADHNGAPSLAFGASRHWESTSLNLTAEWFAGVPEYRVLDTAPIASSDAKL